MSQARIVIGASALAACVAMGGCLASGSSSVRTSGQHVSDETLALIEPRSSTERELLDLLGPPSRTMHHHDGRTVHAYAYSMDARSSGSVFLIAAGSSRTRVERTTYFEIQDGLVTRFWTDGPRNDERLRAKGSDERRDEDWQEVDG